ncbi:uncharacterized protein LOC110992271 [Pieris rapae]|uniref:uncharacterized protein LOC110992271 n=1 Tax=Pieris rapae TaxID=64459 RepID=UPI001E27CB72|nr:uncharacterized protein LOC110992271 [Pieris rapae]
MTVANVKSGIELKFVGPYDPVWKTYELCKGPKFKNASETDVDVFQQGKDYYGTFKFKFLTRSLVDEIRLWLYSVVGDTRKQLWSHKLSDPCKNFVFAELIQEQLNSAKCIVEQGPYGIRWTRYNICPGSKSKNSTNITLALEKENEDYFAKLTIDVLVKTSIDEVKVWVYKMKNENKSLLWVYKSSDACKHFIFAEIIKKQLNARNCVIEKGASNMTLNFTEITKNMIGSSFFYGNYSMKSIATSKKANFLCFIFDVEFYKKNV